MKRRLLPLLLLSALLLSGCGSSKAETNYQQFAQRLAEQETLSFQSRLRAEYPDKTVSFTLNFSRDGERDTVTVIAPELIAGLSAHVERDGSSLEFDGMILDTGPLDESGLSPMAALPALVDTLANGHLDSTWEDQGETVVQLIADDTLSVRVWFRPDSMTPTYAELLSGEDITILCEIENWS